MCVPGGFHPTCERGKRLSRLMLLSLFTRRVNQLKFSSTNEGNPSLPDDIGLLDTSITHKI